MQPTSSMLAMPVHQAIETRRSIFQFTPDPVPQALLERLLAAGTWAPNHHLTEPWRFTVVGSATHTGLARRYAELRQAKLPANATDQQRQKQHAADVQKFLSKPTVVIVSYVLADNDQQRREDYAATCCAIQNIQLAAWAEGIGVQWSTGALIFDPQTYQQLGIEPEQEEMIALLYMGYPAETPTRSRKPLADVLRYTP